MCDPEIIKIRSYVEKGSCTSFELLDGVIYKWNTDESQCVYAPNCM